MNPKETWPVTKFIIEATGFGKKAARKILEEISPEKYSELFQKARTWNLDSAHEASKQLEELLKGESIETLRDAARRAIKPSTEQERGDDEEETPVRPTTRKAKKKRL